MAKQEIASMVRAIMMVWVLNSGMCVALLVFWFVLVVVLAEGWLIGLGGWVGVVGWGEGWCVVGFRVGVAVGVGVGVGAGVGGG